MKLAIATNDKQTIPRGPFAESRYFCVVELKHGRPFSDECRTNPFTDHHTPGKSDRILRLLGDCDALVGRGFGSRFFTRVAGEPKLVILTPAWLIDEVVQAFVTGDLHGFKRLDSARRTFVPMEIAVTPETP